MRLTEEEEDLIHLTVLVPSSLSFQPSNRLQPNSKSSALPGTKYALLQRDRSGSLNALVELEPERESKGLLEPEESGIAFHPGATSVSSLELQKRYRMAFSTRVSTAEATHERVVTVASSSGRRKSVSRSVLSLAPPVASTSTLGQPRTFSTLTHPAAAAASSSSTPVERATSQFFNVAPPLAESARRRRYSTSAIVDKSSDENSSPPRADQSFLDGRGNVSKSNPPVRGAPARKASQAPSWGTGTGQFPSSQAVGRYESLMAAKKSGDHATVVACIRAYLAYPTEYNVMTHHLAMESFLATRLPDSSITKILDLYNQMFDHQNLSPNNRTYEIVINAFCRRDREVVNSIRFLRNRTTKVDITIRARGPYHRESLDASSLEHDQRNAEKMALLEAEDYYTPAVKIYTALGMAADALKVNAINALLAATAERNRIDLALTLFSRLENSMYDKPIPHTYEILLDMFSKDKDLEGVKSVFESFLVARENGSLRKASTVVGRETHVRTANKHRHDSAMAWSVATEGSSGHRAMFYRGDENVWRAAIRAHFECEDPEGAVGLIERMVSAIERGEHKEGFPSEISALSLSSMVSGFTHLKDDEAALRWFGKTFEMTRQNDEGEMVPIETPLPFFRTAFYSAVEEERTRVLNTVLDKWIVSCGKGHKPSISEYTTALDLNIIQSYDATTEALQRQAAERVYAIRRVYLQQSTEGLVQDAPTGMGLGSGVNTRILNCLAWSGFFDQAAEVYVHGVKDLERSGVFSAAIEGQETEVFRSPADWARTLTGDQLSAALGQVAVSQGQGEGGRRVMAYRGNTRPSIKTVLKVMAAAKPLYSLLPFDGPHVLQQRTVVEVYLLAKAHVGGDVAKLGLVGPEWLIVIEAFADVAFDNRTGPLTFDFPGFNSIIDDFASSGVALPTKSFVGFHSLLKTLRRGDVAEHIIRATFGVLDADFALSAKGEESIDRILGRAELPTFKSAPGTKAPKLAKQLPGIKALNPASALAATTRPDASLPQPPPALPTYLAALPALPYQVRGAVDRRFSLEVETNITADSLGMYRLVVERAPAGQFAHPEILGRLVQQLGRDGQGDPAKEIYRMAFELLRSFADDLRSKSISWITLEDNMIIGLCMLGELSNVAVHRDLLLSAGSAPSADGYAAMILNMKETTDDAAVALELFEESQRLNVLPNVYLFNTLISKLSRARRASDALEYFEYMKTIGLRPSSITYGAIINACCKTGDDQSADFLFNEMVRSPGFRPRVPPYNTMIQFFTQTKPNRERAVFYYDAMIKAGVQPTAHTYKLLLDVYGSIQPQDLPQMEIIFSQIESDKSVTLSSTHWASIINAYGIGASDLPQAIAVFEGIEEKESSRRSGFKCDAVVYESLLNVCLAHHRPDLCEKFLVEMESKGVRKTAYVVNTLIKVRSLPSSLFLPSLDDQ